MPDTTYNANPYYTMFFPIHASDKFNFLIRNTKRLIANNKIEQYNNIL